MLYVCLHIIYNTSILYSYILYKYKTNILQINCILYRNILYIMCVCIYIHIIFLKKRDLGDTMLSILGLPTL